MIAVVDYDTGNLRSVADALRRAGAEFTLTADAALLRAADRVILPGVGEASSAMAKLRERGLDEVLPTLTCPVLGICIGMQLMCLSSEEGDATCLGIFPTRVRRLDADPDFFSVCGGLPALPDTDSRTAAPTGTQAVSRLKVPHVGWDTISALRTPLFAGLPEESYVYYVHSYAADPCASTIAATEYGRRFSAALARDNFYGTQFHPEKSGATGATIIGNFLKLQR
ncbi:MAG TPA: imidazole glycerol phosphate synthase subunit HisH [Candidatus Alistipes intestinigallinarum]|uniref:Imidazole glycerol phosphate synthase subunit HisH n=1 Tax=Candidatus Alistipes intestinigallinarum TaxID=2838440 RepID=A0A9D2CBW4_9BACT|nr:imidazole glycerol phosphate synthase subunit HisH [Candidatus Alistipes intestinigallinarum]